MRHPRAAAPAPRGIATLAVVVVLLIAASLIVFFANRSLIFEQRTSANHTRAAVALAAAESGLEWAMAQLNDPRSIGPQCSADSGAAAERRPFRERYAHPAGGTGAAPTASVRPGCQMLDSSLVCACPQPGQRPDLLGDAPTFTIEVAAVAGDTEALRITSRGCTSAARDCVPGGGAEPADAVAVVQSLVKRVPPWTTAPGAAATAQGAIRLEAGVRLVNTDSATQGLVVHAAGSLSGAGFGAADHMLITVPGSPLEAAVLSGDGSLATADGETFFTRRFARTPARYRDDPAVRLIQGCAAADCAAQIAAAVAEGYSAFFVEGDLVLDLAASAQAMGTPARPVLLVVSGHVRAIGAVPWVGLVHTLGDATVEGIDLQGALVSGGDLRLAGSAAVAYAPSVLQRLRDQLGSFARVAGSWRDGRCLSDDPALPCAFTP